MQYADTGSNTNLPKLAYSVKEAAQATSLSVAYLRKKIKSEELKVERRGSRTLILSENLRAFICAGGEQIS